MCTDSSKTMQRCLLRSKSRREGRSDSNPWQFTNKVFSSPNRDFVKDDLPAMDSPRRTRILKRCFTPYLQEEYCNFHSFTRSRLMDAFARLANKRVTVRRCCSHSCLCSSCCTYRTLSIILSTWAQRALRDTTGIPWQFRTLSS